MRSARMMAEMYVQKSLISKIMAPNRTMRNILDIELFSIL